MASIKEAKQFVKDWTGKGDEKQDTQKFWIQLLDKVFEDHNYIKDIAFEQTADKVEGGKNFKDAILYRHTDHAVLIEQKGMKWALDQKEQRFGRIVTPFEQAKHYDDLSAVTDKARWIITCNFQEFWIYDMTKTGKELFEPVAKLSLQELPKHLDWLDMLAGKQETHDFTEEVDVSVKAGDLVGILYNDLHKNYKDPDDKETLRQLNILCVRIVFCLYAEDAGLFNKNNRKMFHDYLAQYDARGMRKALEALFEVLDQKEEERDPYLADDNPLLAEFPYVNGGLFAGKVTIPPFTDETVDILLNKESLGFDWSKISPTIFGAVFESTLNPEKRREGGMHYTSVENIHKVIDPLFLDDLTNELNSILALKTVNTRNRRLMDFQVKLSKIRCFDPACGSGNFLTESYLSLRRLENKALKALIGDNLAFGFLEENVNPIKVSIQQFYGIEINDFAVSVARTALWIAEAQMFEETQTILNSNKDFLPLETFTNIHEGNALRMDWNTVIDRRTEHLYIMGNPPFVGYVYQSKQQKSDLVNLPYDLKSLNIDYVVGWYYKAAEFINETNNKASFVSTNSIVQGEQVNNVWHHLFNHFHLKITFAYRTFVWNSEAISKASVHCVIIGFACNDGCEKKILFDEQGNKKIVSNINAYLVDGPSVFIEKLSKPLCDVGCMDRGSQPTDDGNLIFTVDERNSLVQKYPILRPYIKPYEMGKDFIQRKPRYCLWLYGTQPSVIKGCPEIIKRIENVRKFRLRSTNAGTRKAADVPYLFEKIKQPTTNFIALPKVSSQRRKYVPMDFMKPDVIVGDMVYLINDADIYMFGIMESKVHMAWMRLLCGRLKSDYRYGSTLVYNTFPWPNVSETKRKKIESTAQAILDARNIYPTSSLADLYDPDIMPVELKNSHDANDKAVMDAYGFKYDMSEAEIVAELMKMYQQLVSKAS
ncbi:MAG: hypothetical protein LKE61_04000 [Erysipelotrichaceae bacterium]|jgi:type I restriction-modification system DNA methylase subunit|nr:hypothetical protein [Erysipelotrichaceae bacterium]MCH4044986.1 hypothetical protein [Erysipelotrichaceae bacterium]MCH4122198.1 hypothetical protein [Erysipelotrichaceae bacterium]MCI1362442.1 hypothetical protein [Solobacterium sp.]MCI1462260.1 hypothetical protein [Solobacterium sp.]